MNLARLLTVSLASVAALTSAALAAPVVGSIGFGTTYIQNGGTQGDLTTATSFTITNVTISNDNGNLDGSTNPTFFSPVNQNGNNLSGATLWTVLNGGKTFTFVISTVTNLLNNPDAVSFKGFGTIDDGAGGLDPTTGEWQLGFGVSGTAPFASFTWQATTAAVPEGGATIMLLGASLAALAFARRKLLA
jgi:hypothetical protein